MNISSRSLSPETRRSGLTNKALNLLSKRLWLACVSKIELELDNGEVVPIGQTRLNTKVPRIRLNRPGKLLRLSHRGILGWAEAYIAGYWETPCLNTLVEWAMINEQALEKAFSASWLNKKIHRLLHLFKNNSRRGSRKNISAHYDLGNDFYRHWLDSSMTYSAAVFESEDQTLEQAQENKYHKFLELMELPDNASVLEIGCGWGGLARTLASNSNASYQGVTLSKEQLAYAQQTQNKKDNYQFELKDYRDLDGQYDRIASIEMFEAVGEAHWTGYFQQLFKRLKPGGIAVLQVITIADERFAHYRRHADFIQRYVFPGGMLPSHSVFQEQIHRCGLKLGKSLSFGADYAETLRHWSKRFNQAWPEIERQGFDQKFFRLWNFYLSYCEAGFNHKSIDVRFYQLIKPEVHG